MSCIKIVYPLPFNITLHPEMSALSGAAFKPYQHKGF